MKLRAAAAISAIVMSLACALPVFAAGGLQYQSSFEGGCLYRAGEVRVVELTGSYRQMGRQ